MQNSQNLNHSITMHPCPSCPGQLPIGFTANGAAGQCIIPLLCRYPSLFSQQIDDAALKKLINKK